MEEQTLYEGKYILLKKKQFPGPDGKIINWEFAERVGQTQAVAFFGLTVAEELIVIRQFRPPVNSQTIELPAGLMDIPGETPQQTIERELAEETGYECKTIQPLIEAYSTPGMSSEKVSIFWGRVGQKQSQNLDDAEDIYVYPPVPLTELMPFLHEESKKGIIIDYKIQAAYAQYSWLNNLKL